MPKKGRRKSSFGRSSVSEGAKKNAKHYASHDVDEINSKSAKRMKINRYKMGWNDLRTIWIVTICIILILKFWIITRLIAKSCQFTSVIAKLCQFMSKSLQNRVNSRQSLQNCVNSRQSHCKIVSIHVIVIAKSCQFMSKSNSGQNMIFFSFFQQVHRQLERNNEWCAWTGGKSQ